MVIDYFSVLIGVHSWEAKKGSVKLSEKSGEDLSFTIPMA